MTATEAGGRCDAAVPKIERVAARLRAYLGGASHLVEGNAFHRRHTLVRFDQLIAGRRNPF